MELNSLPSTHYSHPLQFPSRKPNSTTATTAAAATSYLSISLDSETQSTTSSSVISANLRRPQILKPSSSPSPQVPNFHKNPLKKFVNPSSPPIRPPVSDNLSTKLWLSTKLSPPPPPPPPPLPPSLKEKGLKNASKSRGNEERDKEEVPVVEFRQVGKIFVGNLPVWIKKHEVAEFFRQFGPIKNVILIKGHNETEQNSGFGFVIYGGPTAEKSALKAVEFDGIEFHGRVLTVKLDDGKKMKGRADERVRWVEGVSDGLEHPSKWHEERDDSRKDFRRVLETEPENWQAVIQAFQSIEKVWTFITTGIFKSDRHT